MNYVLSFSLGYISVISGTIKSPEKSAKKQKIIVLQEVLDSPSNAHAHAHACAHTHTMSCLKTFVQPAHVIFIQKLKKKIK